MDLHTKDSSPFVDQQFHSNYPKVFYLFKWFQFSFSLTKASFISVISVYSITAEISQNTQGKVHPGATRVARCTKTPTNRSTESRDCRTSIGRSSRFGWNVEFERGPTSNGGYSYEETMLSHTNCNDFLYLNENKYYQIFINILFIQLFFYGALVGLLGRHSP